MTDLHGTPLTSDIDFDLLPDEIQEEIRADFAALKANLPPSELPEHEEAGIGATSSGYLVVKTKIAAYQLMEDGSTMRARPTDEGLEMVHFKDGEAISRSVVKAAPKPQ